MLVLFGLVLPAHAVSFAFQPVVITGDAVGDLPAGAVFDQFFGVSLNDAGEVVFSSFVSGGSVTAADNELISRAAAGGAISTLVREGDAAPGAGAGVVYSSPGSAVHNDAGQLAWSPELSDGANTWGALYVPGVSGPSLFAQEGDPAPGAGGATWNSFTHLIAPTIAGGGAVAFQANLSGTGFGSSIWGPDAAGHPELVAQEGTQAPGFAAGVEFDQMISAPLLNETGRLAFSGTLGGTGGGESVLWVRDGSGTPTALAQGSGSTAALGLGESFGNLSLLELDDAGNVVFHAFLSGVGVTGSNDGSLWRGDGSGDPTLLVREGDAAPGTGTGVTFSGVQSARLAQNGTLAFAADLAGLGVNAGNDRALYTVDASDQLDLILRSGDAAPGLSGLSIADLPYEPIIDADGNFVFHAALGGSGVDASNDLALFYYDALADALSLVVREGDAIEAAPGDVRTIGTLFSPDLNDAGQLSLFVSFVAGGQGIFLTAIPEPGTGVLLTLGCVGLASRRRRVRARAVRGRGALLAVGAALALGTAGAPAQAQITPVIPDDFSGIDAALLHGTVTPPGAEIQQKFVELEAYDELVYGYPTLTEPEITTTYFKDGAFKPVANPSRTYFPRSDVKIVRDAEWGVPHIYGLTDAAAAFGAGYAAAEDRLPIIMLLVALGRSEAFELTGDNATWLADFETARLYGYTEAEFQAMIDRLPVVFGQDGQDIKDLLTELTHGMNAALLQMQLGLLPVPPGVVALGGLPAPFQPTDIVAIVSIVRALFGAGGGGELGNASRMLSLVNQYGVAQGMAIYEDFRNRFNDDGVVHTTDSFPYGQVPATIDPNSSPYPVLYSGGDPGLQATFEDLLFQSFPGGFAQAQLQTDDLAEQARIKYENLVIDAGGVRLDLSHPGQLSNYVVVDGTVTTTGHPILLGGPQAGYFDPQILVENELHGDRIHARGAGFPGMGFVVIGRNQEAAWTPTAGGSDMVDIYLEELCEPDGSTANENALHYLFNGQCIPMDRRTIRLASDAPIDLPGRELLPDIIVERTVHGTLVGRGRIGTKAVAVARKRSTYLKELDAAICILRLNRNEVPNGAKFVQDFTESMNLSTNWAFANADEIAYVHGGLYPVRPPDTHPDLPLWGTGGYEWQNDPGLANVARIQDPATDNDDVYLSDLAPQGVLSLHPHELAPERHYTVSWNNRPAPDWSSSDSQWGYSSLYRADMLEDLVLHEIQAGRLISPVRLVQIMEHAGLTDFRGSHVLPEALAILKQAQNIGDREQAMIDELEDWAESWHDFANARGPLRRDGDRDGEYDHAVAIGIMDAWWDPMIHAMFDPALGRAVNTVSRQGFHNAPGSGGSAFQGGFYGQVRTDLAMVLGNPLASPTSQTYCGTLPGVGVNGSLQDCANALLASLESIDPSPADAFSERILFLPTAALSMHWVNRPTTQGIAMFGSVGGALPEAGRGAMLAAGVALIGIVQLWRRRGRRQPAPGPGESP